MVLFAVFPPAAQDFPLNDDWAFGRSALLFARGEGIHYLNWASMPQLGQWLWACPFLWLLGASFFALRLSTIVMSWLGLWAFYDLLRQQNWTPIPATLATAALAFSPLFFLLQGTFMTDVPALSLALLALAFYGRAIGGRRAGWLAAAVVAAPLAVLTRQNTVAVPLTAAVLLWRTPDLRSRPLWWLGVLLPAAVGVITHLWFQRRTDVRPTEFALLAPASVLLLPFVIIHLAGLTALPLFLLAPRAENWKTLAWAFAAMLAFAGYWLLYGVYLPYGGLFPYSENMLTPYGAFAGSNPRLSLGLLVPGDRPPLLGTTGRVFLSLLGCAVGSMLVARAAHNWRAGSWSQPLILFALLQMGLFLLMKDIYDRYFLFLLPTALFLARPPTAAAALPSPRMLLGGLAVIAVLVLLSTALMHDWLSWNSARWQLGLRAVQNRRIDPLSIEGGVEWDGWYTVVSGKRLRPQPPRWPVLPFTRDWFPWITGRYCLSFSELKGARRLDAEPYSLWLVPGSRQFYLLELPPLVADPRNGGRPAPPRGNAPAESAVP